jgi:hypothetical protein
MHWACSYHRQNTEVIPGTVVIEIVRQAPALGVGESDFIRWVGVAVAVAGAFLATPEGIASVWRYVKQRHGKVLAFARRLLRRPRGVAVHGGLSLGSMAFGGRGYVSKWQPWLPRADGDLKIDILHKQVDILVERVDELRNQIDRTSDDLQKCIKEAEARVAGQVRELASELRGERSQASRVDARGLGPIALGIVLTGIPDELATVPWVGYLAIAVSVIWTYAACPSWLRDYKRALESVEDQ